MEEPAKFSRRGFVKGALYATLATVPVLAVDALGFKPSSILSQKSEPLEKSTVGQVIPYPMSEFKTAEENGSTYTFSKLHLVAAAHNLRDNQWYYFPLGSVSYPGSPIEDPMGLQGNTVLRSVRGKCRHIDVLPVNEVRSGESQLLPSLIPIPSGLFEWNGLEERNLVFASKFLNQYSPEAAGDIWKDVSEFWRTRFTRVLQNGIMQSARYSVEKLDGAGLSSAYIESVVDCDGKRDVRRIADFDDPSREGHLMSEHASRMLEIDPTRPLRGSMTLNLQLYSDKKDCTDQRKVLSKQVSHLVQSMNSNL